MSEPGPQQTSAPQALDDWQRLDPRMLVVYPITEIVKYIPVLLGTLIVGTTSGNPLWSLIPVVLIAGFGAARFFTTSYRIDADHVQLRTGIVQRRTLSVPRPRIRSVDVEADLLHRILGLAVLAIGTGNQATKGEEFKLDALDTSRIPALRAELLAHTGNHAPVSAEPGVAHHVPPFDATAESGVEIGHWRAAWVRYAPLSLTGLAIIAPIAGIGAQYGLIDVLSSSAPVEHIDEDSTPVVVIVIAGLTLLSLALVSLAACGQYLATWFGLRVLDNGTTLHLRHGLFTTRQITLDLARFRGATLSEPLLLRAARAAQLEMIMTGENPRQKILPQAPRTAVERTLDELLRTRRRPGSTTQAPATDPHNQPDPGPNTLAVTFPGSYATPHTPATAWGPPATTAPDTTAMDDPHSTWRRPTAGSAPTGPSAPPPITGPATPDAPVGTPPSLTKAPTRTPAPQPVSGATLGTIELHRHGPAARRRRYTKAAWPVGILVAAMLVLMWAGVDLPGWTWTSPVTLAVVMAILAEDRYRGLGHRVLPGTTGPTWLITRRGSLDRNRDCLEAPGIIGWTVRQTFWQRRSGLASVVAATAAGKKAYLVDDIPHDQALALIEAVTPGRLGHR
ncbi:PH domain-containing protein [Nocardia mangyaensis]|uniref:PH domain-containing protein n=1 Tax=Nocardia mangyaensis TaxID=2213200 RepID=UPI000AB3A7C0